MAEFQIITDYNLNTPWILTDTTLTDMAVGKLASLGSDQGDQLRAQTQVLQQQMAEIESLRDLIPKFSDANFVRIPYDFTAKTFKVTALWDITDIANSFPNRSLAGATDATIQRLIDFFNGINQVYSDIGSTTRLDPNYFRITYKDSPSDITTKTLISTRPPGVDSSTGQAYFYDDNNQRHDIILVKNEPFAVPINAAEYQNWLQMAALTRADALNKLFSKYQVASVTGEAIQWQVVKANGTGETFIGNIPVPTNNRALETVEGRVVLDPDGKYYRVTKSFIFGVRFAETEEVKAISPLNQPLIFAPTSDTLRDIRSRFSEATLQVTQRNASQQLLVNSLLVSYNYHFDAAANVLKAFSDLRNKVAGNV